LNSSQKKKYKWLINTWRRVFNILCHKEVQIKTPDSISPKSEWLSSRNNKLVRMWCGEGILKQCWWERKLVQPLWKSVWKLLKKLKIELQYDPATVLLGIYLKECKSAHSRVTYKHMFTAALFTGPRKERGGTTRSTYIACVYAWS
jgi:hypothetical protein